MSRISNPNANCAGIESSGANSAPPYATKGDGRSVVIESTDDTLSTDTRDALAVKNLLANAANTIESVAHGEMVVVCDDESRENECDLVMAKADPDMQEAWKKGN